MVIWDLLSWLGDGVRLGLGRIKKDEQRCNARSFGMKTTSTENVWLGWAKGDFRKKDLGSMI